MNSRWPELDYYYHLKSIHDEVVHHQQVAKAKQARKQIKAPPGNPGSRLVKTLVHLRKLAHF